MSNIEENEELIAKLKAFDMGAIEWVYDQYNEAIYRYGYRLLGNQEKADECVAETFSRLLNALKNGKGPKKYVRPYLYRTAHNWITDQYRRINPIETEFSDDFEDIDEQLEEKVFSHIENTKIRSVLWELPENQRQAVVLKYLEGLENAEISEVLNKPVGAVKALQHRGLQAIRKKLKV